MKGQCALKSHRRPGCLFEWLPTFPGIIAVWLLTALCKTK